MNFIYAFEYRIKIMKLIKFIILITLLTTASFSQNPHNWHYCGPLETPVNITALYLYGDSSIIAATVRHEMYISHNNGTTWDTLTQDLPFSDGVKHLEMVNGVLYAGILADQSGTGIWKSLDTGKTWEGTHYPGRDVDGFTWFGDYIFASNSPVHRSADSGRTWESFALPTSQVCMALDHLGDTLYAATYNGMYWSLDTAKTWNTLYGAGNAVGFVTLCSIGDILIAGREDGIIRSENRGINWNKTYSGGYSFCFNMGDSLIFFRDGVHYRSSSDSGTTWIDYTQYDSSGSQLPFWQVYKNKCYYFVNNTTGIYRQKTDDSTIAKNIKYKNNLITNNNKFQLINRGEILFYSTEKNISIKIFCLNGKEIETIIIRKFNNFYLVKPKINSTNIYIFQVSTSTENYFYKIFISR